MNPQEVKKETEDDKSSEEESEEEELDEYDDEETDSQMFDRLEEAQIEDAIASHERSMQDD